MYPESEFLHQRLRGLILALLDWIHYLNFRKIHSSVPNDDSKDINKVDEDGPSSSKHLSEATSSKRLTNDPLQDPHPKDVDSNARVEKQENDQKSHTAVTIKKSTKQSSVSNENKHAPVDVNDPLKDPLFSNDDKGSSAKNSDDPLQDPPVSNDDKGSSAKHSDDPSQDPPPQDVHSNANENNHNPDLKTSPNHNSETRKVDENNSPGPTTSSNHNSESRSRSKRFTRARSTL